MPTYAHQDTPCAQARKSPPLKGDEGGCASAATRYASNYAPFQHFAYLSLTIICLSLPAHATDYKPNVLDPRYAHTKYGPSRGDLVQEFEAFTASMDGNDDDNGDGSVDVWGIPEWVAYEIKGLPIPPRKGPGRPSPWITDKALYRDRVAPNDDSYRNSGYDRGHMCQKLIAFRLGEDADWNSHTVLNAAPQLHEFNDGIWGDLEDLTAGWADEFGQVWVICGPVFDNKKPSKWIGDGNEVRVAVPDAFFKIVIRERGKSIEVLAFLYPHENLGTRRPYNHRPYLASVDAIETKTGLDFLGRLPGAEEKRIESKAAAALWP